jgi:hypothetical protein
MCLLQAAVGFEYAGKTEKHQSQTGLWKFFFFFILISIESI